MQRLQVTVAPEGAFGTIPKGDTLFGTLCWALVRRSHNLSAFLKGYTEGHPFLVVSDAFPAGFLPRPAKGLEQESTPAQRKEDKKKNVANIDEFCKPLRDIQAEKREMFTEDRAYHNTVSRMSGTTGKDMFAPYQMDRLWPCMEDVPLWDIYILLDEALEKEALLEALSDIGAFGFGRDASIGYGRFTVKNSEGWMPPVPDKAADAVMTLAPCAPQGLPWIREKCFYKPFTRFGRHGDVDAISGNPYKHPVLMADTGAVLTPSAPLPEFFTGNGIGGVSQTRPETVQQGYAPVVPVYLGG